VAAWALAAGPARGQPAFDIGAVRRNVEMAVCTVTVETEWGVPLAVATGFLLGDGRFAVTDLGAVAQPGAARAVLEFSDSNRIVCDQFGLADPALGLVALRIRDKIPGRPGLRLVAEPPTLDGGVVVAAVGWEWARNLAAAQGRLWRGPAIKDIAARTQVETPPGIEHFIRVDGGRLTAASGAPVVAADAAVAAVRLDVAARNVNVALAIPAWSLRESLLGAEPRLQPLRDLPAPLWPVNVLRLAGPPATPDGFAQATQAIREAFVCPECEGKGTVEEDRGGLLRRSEDVPCPLCRGEKIAATPQVYQMLSAWAEQGTRIIWAPVSDEATHRTAVKTGLDMLKFMAVAGRQFRRTYDDLAAKDLSRASLTPPRGAVFYAMVRDTVTGPDGKYFLLEIPGSTVPLAVRADDMAGPTAKSSVTGSRSPALKSWLVVAGTILARCDVGRQQGLFMLPYWWTATTPPLTGRPGR
jgi:hypothetical protein